MIELAGYAVLAVRWLSDMPFESFCLRLRRTNGFGIAGPADRGPDVRLGNRRVDGTGRTRRIGQHPMMAGPARPGKRPGDLSRVMDGQQAPGHRSAVMAPPTAVWPVMLIFSLLS